MPHRAKITTNFKPNSIVSENINLIITLKNLMVNHKSFNS